MGGWHSGRVMDGWLLPDEDNARETFLSIVPFDRISNPPGSEG